MSYLSSGNQARTGAKGFLHVAMAAAIAVMLAVTGCSNPQKDATKTARQWLDALNAGNLTAAQEMSTRMTAGLIQTGATMGENMAVGDYEIVDVEMINDTAATITVAVENKQSHMVLDLVKIDGNWKVGTKK